MDKSSAYGAGDCRFQRGSFVVVHTSLLRAKSGYPIVSTPQDEASKVTKSAVSQLCSARLDRGTPGPRNFHLGLSPEHRTFSLQDYAEL